jgi:hypothetical protein
MRSPVTGFSITSPTLTMVGTYALL